MNKLQLKNQFDNNIFIPTYSNSTELLQISIFIRKLIPNSLKRINLIKTQISQRFGF